MTIQESMDELQRLSNPQAAKKHEQERNRSSFRPPFKEMTADIVGLEGPYKALLNNGQEVTRIALKLANIHSVKADVPFTDAAYNLELGLPANPNPNSELVLMVASAQEHSASIQGIRDLVGLKGVRLVEQVHEFRGRRQDPPNSGKWVDADMETRFYALVSIGGASANGSAPAVTEDRLVEAIQMIEGLSHADAQTVLGDDAAAVLSKLVVTKRVKQVEGLYQKMEAS